APTTPTDRTATAVSFSQIDLSWNASTDSGGSGLAGYQIDYSSGSAGPWSMLTFTDLTTHSDISLSAGTTRWYRVQAVDLAGNESSFTDPVSATTPADSTAPGIPVHVAPADGSFTWDSTPTFDWSDVTDASGVTYSLIVCEVVDDGAVAPVERISQTGLVSSSFTPSSPLADGTHIWHVLAVDGAGNVGAWSSDWTFTIDTLPPSVPSTPDLLSASDSGTSSLDNITNDTTPTFTGTAQAGTTVRLYAGGSLVGAVTTDVFGAYSVTASAVADGTHAFTAIATDRAGNTSVPSLSLTVVIDTAPPATPSRPDLTWSSDSGSSAYDNITRVKRPTFTAFSEVGATVKLYTGLAFLSSAVVNSYGYCYLTPTLDLADGSHTITATATDRAGNTSVPSLSLTVVIDTAPPATPAAPDLISSSDFGISSIDNITSNTVPTFSGVVEPSATVKLYTGATLRKTTIASSSTGAYQAMSSSLSAGSYIFTVVAVDRAGNSSWASPGTSVTIDTTAPAVAQMAGVPPAATSDNTPTFSGGAEPGAMVRLYVAGNILVGTSWANANGLFSVTAFPRADGTYSFTLVVTDIAGNVGAATAAITVYIDTTPPAAPSLLMPGYGRAYRNSLFTFDWSDVTDPSGVTYMLWVGERTEVQGAVSYQQRLFQTGLTGSTFVSALALSDGTYGWMVRAVDGVGNAGPWTDIDVFTIDTQVPGVPTGLTVSADTVSSISLWWNPSADTGAGVDSYDVERVLSDGSVSRAWSAQSPHSSDTNLDGRVRYSYRIRVRDLAGNASAWSDPVTLDARIVDLPPGDDVTHVIPLPFTFRYGDASYTSLNACSNGWISPRSNWVSSANTGLPSSQAPVDCIAAFWDDLYPMGGADGKMWYERLPYEVLIVWAEVSFARDRSRKADFAVSIRDDGQIGFWYGRLDLVDSYTQGYQIGVGDAGEQWVYTEGSPTNPSHRTFSVLTTTPPAPTVLALGDDVTRRIDLPFTFWYGGNPYTSVYVCSNGWISPTSDATDYSNRSLPTSWAPADCIAAFWDDLYPVGGTHGTVTIEPSFSQVVIRWNAVSFYIDRTRKATFSITLRDDSTIEFSYGQIGLSYSYTQGFQYGAGGWGKTWVYGQSQVPLPRTLLPFYGWPSGSGAPPYQLIHAGNGAEELQATMQPGLAETSRQIDVVIIGDGFAATDVEEFRRYSEEAASGILARLPFSENADKFNFWRVLPLAAVPGETRLTVPDPSPYNFGRIDSAIEAVADFCPGRDLICLIVKSLNAVAFYDGKFSVIATGMPPFADAVAHEFGHQFGRLGDEYLNPVYPSDTYAMNYSQVRSNPDGSLQSWVPMGDGTTLTLTRVTNSPASFFVRPRSYLPGNVVRCSRLTVSLLQGALRTEILNASDLQLTFNPAFSLRGVTTRDHSNRESDQYLSWRIYPQAANTQYEVRLEGLDGPVNLWAGTDEASSAAQDTPEPNLTHFPDTTNKWIPGERDSLTGAVMHFYEGAAVQKYFGLWRPTGSACLMNGTWGPYCLVCRRAIAAKIASTYGTANWSR
ncbi:MAG: hypothetical protein HYY16_11000, partial [Planctomycetes bacterium]|nr:hypothetical protein [Planctomycetota bacterium]